MGKTNDEAVEELTEWADFWDLDPDRELFKVVVDELRYQVKKDRVSFDIESEVFKCVLRKPIKNGDSEIAIVEIKQGTMEDKKVLQKYSDDESIQASIAMIAKYTSLRTSDVCKLYDRDISNINAIISGFITQILPDKKK